MKLELNKVKGDFGMTVTNQTGQSIAFDANKDIGGQDFGIRPMEAVAASLAACSSIDVLLILKKQKHLVVDYSVSINAERTDSIPAIFKRIDLEFKFKGDIPTEHLKRAVDLSMTKYCSVTKILEPTCKISYTISLID